MKMNFKKFMKEVHDPEKIGTNIVCSSCGKRLAPNDLHTYQTMNQDTNMLCSDCQSKINKVAQKMNNDQLNKIPIKKIQNGASNFISNIDVWGKKQI